MDHDPDRLTLWPSYFDVRRSRRSGRRVAKDAAVKKPDLEGLYTAARAVGLRKIKREANAASLELIVPSRCKGLEDGPQIGSRQGRFAGLSLQLGRVEDQAETVDLFAALHINLLKALDRNGGQVPASQHRSDQGADCCQWGSDLMGQRFEQGKFLVFFGCRGWC